MPPNILEYTPVRPRAGGEVHATSFQDPGRTICNRAISGWIIVPVKLSCKRCKELIHYPVGG